MPIMLEAGVVAQVAGMLVAWLKERMLKKKVSVIQKDEVRKKGRPQQDCCCRAWNDHGILDLRSSRRDMNLASL